MTAIHLDSIVRFAGDRETAPEGAKLRIWFSLPPEGSPQELTVDCDGRVDCRVDVPGVRPGRKSGSRRYIVRAFHRRNRIGAAQGVLRWENNRAAGPIELGGLLHGRIVSESGEAVRPSKGSVVRARLAKSGKKLGNNGYLKDGRFWITVPRLSEVQAREGATIALLERSAESDEREIAAQATIAKFKWPEHEVDLVRKCPGADEGGKIVLYGNLRYEAREAAGKALHARVIQSHLRGEEVVHEARLPAKDSFRIAFDPPCAPAPLRLEILTSRDSTNDPLFVSEEFPPEAGRRMMLIRIGDPKAKQSKFHWLLAAAASHLEDLSIVDLDDGQWRQLLKRARIAPEDAARLRRAVALVRRLSAYVESGATAYLPIFFIFAGDGAAPRLATLFSADDSAQRREIDDAVSAGDIGPSPWRFEDGCDSLTLSAETFFALKRSKTGDRILFDLSVEDGNPHTQLAAIAVGQPAKRRKLKQLHDKAGDPIRFLKLVDRSRDFSSREKARIRVAAGLFTLTEQNPRLVQALMKTRRRGGMSHTAEIAAFEPRDLAEIIDSAGGAPRRYRDHDDPALAFAEALLDEVHAKSPTQAFVASIREPRSQSRDFRRACKVLSDHPRFDMFAKPARTHFRASNANPRRNDEREVISPDELALVERTQRVARLSSPRLAAATTAAMFKADIGSAHQIAQMGEARFTAAVSDHLPQQAIEGVFQRAVAVNQATTAIVTDLQLQWQLHTGFSLPAVFQAANPFQTDDLATLESIFGSMDSCACQHCRSVYSPGAYLASLLHWLDTDFTHVDTSGSTRSGYEALVERRADIPLIDLDCENAETLLPHIDLVLEVLEHVVASGSGDLSPLDHQTDWKMPDLRVEGEHFGPLKQSAYDDKHLRGARYPWALPLNLWLELTRAYLKGIGTDRRALVVLKANLAPNQENADTAAEIIGLSKEQADIIDSPNAAADLKVIWNIGNQSFNQFATLASVRVWMDKSGLDYEALLEVLATQYVSRSTLQSNEMIRVAFAADAPCDLSQAKLDFSPRRNLKLGDRFHRLVRLQSSLGWDFWALDEALILLGTLQQSAQLDATFLVDLARLERLRIRTGLPVAELIGWFGQIPAYRGTQPSEWYRSNFLEKAGKGQVAEPFALASSDPPPSDSLTVPNRRLVSAVDRAKSADMELLRETIGLDAAEFEAALAWHDADAGGAAPIDLEGLSRLFRLASLTRTLGLSVTQLDSLFKLSGADPFSWSPSDALEAFDLYRWLEDEDLTPDGLRRLITGRTADGLNLFSDAKANEIAEALYGTDGRFHGILVRELPVLMEPLIGDGLERLFKSAVEAYLPADYAGYLDLIVRGKSDSELPSEQPGTSTDPFDRQTFVKDILPDQHFIQPTGVSPEDAVVDLDDEDASLSNVPDSTPHDAVRKEITRRLFIFQPETASRVELLYSQALDRLYAKDEAATIRNVVEGAAARFPKFMPDGVTEFDPKSYLLENLPPQSVHGFDVAAAVAHEDYPRQPRSTDFNAYTALEVKAEVVQRCAAGVFDQIRDNVQEALQGALVDAYAAGLDLSADETRNVLLSVRSNLLPTAPPGAQTGTPATGSLLPAHQDVLEYRTPVARLTYDPASPPTVPADHKDLLTHVARVAARLVALGLVGADQDALLYYRDLATPGPGVDSANDLSYWFDPFDADAGSPGSLAGDVRQWRNLTRGLGLRESLGLSLDRLVKYLDNARSGTQLPISIQAVANDLLATRPSAPADERLSDILAVLTHQSGGNLEGSVAEFALAAVATLRNLNRWGLTLSQALDFAAYPTDSSLPARVRAAWRNRIDGEENWLKDIREVHDRLRELRRDRLIGYLLGRHVWLRDSNDLYTHFLIDTEMSSCMQTSRTVAAIGSVQHLITRVFLGLEEGLAPRRADRAQAEWEWRKTYRVWEAARKVFLYPENWIEASLRLDKTPFFVELEEELSQGELNEASVEEAVVNYLRKVDEVANLDIRGFCYESKKPNGRFEPTRDTMEVFGRTPALPGRYFHRTRKPITGWTAWCEVEHDIEGDHLIPVYWNRSLHLFWPSFVNKQQDSVDYLELSFNFSRFQSGRWRKKERLPKTILCGPNAGVGVFDNLDLKTKAFDTYAYDGPTVTGSYDVQEIDYYTYTGPRGDLDTVGWEIGSGGSVISLDELSGNAHRVAQAHGISDEHPMIENLRNSANWSPHFKTVDTVEVFDFSQVGLGVDDFLFWAHPDGDAPQDLRIRSRRKFADHLTAAPLAYDMVAYEDGLRLSASYHARLEPDYEVGSPPPPAEKYVHYRPHDTEPTGMKLRSSTSADVRETITSPASIPALYTKKTEVLEDGRPLPVVLEETSGYEIVFAQQNQHHLFKDPFFFGDDNHCYFAWYFRGYKEDPDGAPPYDYHAGYRFETFRIAGAQRFIATVNAGGLDALLAPPKDDELYLQSNVFGPDFDARYAPTTDVAKPTPQDVIDFTYGSPTSQYYLEIFFHIATLLAERYRAEGQFEEALKCLRYVFDPTNLSDDATDKDFWRFRPFRAHDATQSISDMMGMLAGTAPASQDSVVGVLSQIAKWRSDPFDPHGIAALRPLAYMLWVFTSYVETLIEWADDFFTQDTRETINEATQIYTMAAQMLGRKPERIERPDAAPRNFAELRAAGLDAFSNAAVAVESVLPISNQLFGSTQTTAAGPQPDAQALYFCIPENPQLLALWDTIADRLFKIRNCMNIKGEFRSLALFQPPIDPGLLVRARAAGLDIADIVAGLSLQPPHYRFSFLLQKATEFASQVQSLGTALRTAREQRDGEAMAQLRSQQEISLHKAMRNVRTRQIEEAKEQLAGLRESKKIAEIRLQNNLDREYRIKEEREANKLRKKSEDWLMGQRVNSLLAAPLTFIPDWYAGSIPLVKAVGGGKINEAAQIVGMAMSGIAEALRNKSVEAADNASVKRRWEGWRDEERVVRAELVHIDRQIIAAEIRLAIAEQEAANVDLQIEHAQETLEFMRTKFSNEALYDWMAKRLARLHREAYQLALKLARQAERAFELEIGAPENPIGNDHWQPGKGGLLAGEALSQDLRCLDAEYMDRNERRYELRRDVPLRLLDPTALMELAVNGSCEFELPEWLFQMDSPGLFKRMTKSIALSIPAVVGRHTPLHCKLTLLSHDIREAPDLTDPDQPVRRYDAVQSMITSTGLNDTGLFEPNLQDQRYLRFECCGVIARFRLELLNATELDRTTITDVLLHLQYTALEGGDTFRQEEESAAADNIEQPNLLFSMRHEFADEWRAFLASAPNQPTLTLEDDFPEKIPVERMPFRARRSYRSTTDYQHAVAAWALVHVDATQLHELVELSETLSELHFDNADLVFQSTGHPADGSPIVDIVLLYRPGA